MKAPQDDDFDISAGGGVGPEQLLEATDALAVFLDKNRAVQYANAAARGAGIRPDGAKSESQADTDGAGVGAGAPFETILQSDADVTRWESALSALRSGERPRATFELPVPGALFEEATADIVGEFECVAHREDGDVTGVTVFVRPRYNRELPSNREHDVENEATEAGRDSAFLRQVIDALPDTFYVYDDAGNVLVRNEQLSAVTGLDAEELASKKPWEFMPEDDSNRVLQAFFDVIDSGEPRKVEAALQTADGREIPYEFTGGPLRGPDDDVEGLVGIGRDVSERVAHRERLTAVHQATRGLIKASTEETVVQTLTGTIDEHLGLVGSAVVRLHERDAVVESTSGTVPIRQGEQLTDAFEFLAGVLEREEGSVVREPGELGFPAADKLDEYGLFLSSLGAERVAVFVAKDTGTFDHRMLQLLRILRTEATAALERLAREEQLRRSEQRYRALVDQFPNGSVFLFDTDLRYQIARGQGLGDTDHTPSDFEGKRPDEVFDGALAAELVDIYSETLDGNSIDREIPYEELIYRVHTTPVADDDGEVFAGLAITQDVTEEKRRQSRLEASERILRELHDATQDLLRAETPSKVEAAVTEHATSVFGLCCATVARFDPEKSVLRGASPVSETDRLQIEPGDGPIWEVYRSGETATFTDDIPTDVFPEAVEMVVAVPIGEFGVLVAGVTDLGTIESVGIGLVELLAANAEATLQRLRREQELEQVSVRLQSQEMRIHELEGVTDAVSRIQEYVATSETRETLETAVCEELVSTDRIDFAWVGQPRVADADLRPTAWAGAERGYLDAVSVEEGVPATTAATQRRPVTISNVAACVQSEQWAKEALSHEFQSVLSIPLEYDGVLYGTVSAYSRSQGAFDGVAGDLLEDLGSLLANSMSVLERGPTAGTAQVLELEFELRDSQYVPQVLAERTGSKVRFETVLQSDDTDVEVLLSVPSGDPADVHASATELTDVTEVDWFGSPEHGQLALRIARPFLGTTVAKHGGSLAYSVSDGESTRAVVRVPADSATRPLIESLTNAFDDINLVARRQDRTTDLSGGADLGSLLTDRQHEILRAAYHGGYFESPKEITGGQLAAKFDISGPVVHDHLRAAHRRLLDSIFDSTADTDGLT